MPETKPERRYTLAQILKVIKQTSVAEGLPLGISLMDVCAGFKLLDAELDAAEARSHDIAKIRAEAPDEAQTSRPAQRVHPASDPVGDPSDAG